MLDRRTLIGGGTVLAVGAGLFLFRPRAMFRGENITAPDAHARADAGTLTLVDIRRPDEWQATGIGVGAHPVDMRRDDFTGAVLQLVQGNAGAALALICAKGVRSARLSTRLAQSGFGQIINVPEGMLGAPEGPGWIARGLPVRRV
jgi:rhodanese-related sulfurtransferase